MGQEGRQPQPPPDIPDSFYGRVRTPLWEVIFELAVAWRTERSTGNGQGKYLHAIDQLGALVITQFNDRALKSAAREVRDGWRQMSMDPQLMWDGVLKLMARADELEADMIRRSAGAVLPPTKQAAQYLRAAISARGYKMGEYAEECRKKGMKILATFIKQPAGWKHATEVRRIGRAFRDAWNLGQVEEAAMELAEAVEALERVG